MAYPGTVPIRRPQLREMPEDHVLPEVIPPRKHTRRRELASYDVKILPKGADEFVASMASWRSASSTPGAMAGPRTGRDSVATSRSESIGIGGGASRSRSVPLRPHPPASATRSVANYPHQAPPSLLGEIEGYLKDEIRAVEDATGTAPEPGTETRYRLYRNALSFFASHVKSYEGILSAIVREFDMCFEKISERAGESERLRLQVLDEKQMRDQALADMEATHKLEIASILKEAHQTKLDNLLSVEMRRLKEEIKKREEELEQARWENAELLDANKALTELKERVVAEQQAKHKLEGPEQYLPEQVDHLVTSLSSSLFAAFRVINHLKAREVRVAHTQETIEHLQTDLNATNAKLDATTTKKKLVEDELLTVSVALKKLQAEHKALIATKDADTESSTKKRLRSEIEALKEQLNVNKGYYKQKLFELHKQIVNMERIGSDTTLKHCHHLVGRAVVPHGNGAGVSKMLRAPMVDLVPNAGYTPKMVIGEIEGIVRLLQVRVKAMEERSMKEFKQRAEAALTPSPKTADERAREEREQLPASRGVLQRESLDVEGLILSHFARYGLEERGGKRVVVADPAEASKTRGGGATSEKTKKDKRDRDKRRGGDRKDRRAGGGNAAATPEPIIHVDSLAELSAKAQQRLLSFMNSLHQYYRHADCELMLAVLDHKLSCATWERLDLQVATVKSRLKDLAKQKALPSKRDIVHLICTACGEGKSLENALSIFMAICPMGVVPNDFVEFIGEALFGVTEFIKVQYLEEVKLFILQIAEGVRETVRRELPVTRRSVLEVIFTADPRQDAQDVVQVVTGCLETAAEGPVDDETVLRDDDVEDFIARLIRAYPWHKRVPLFTEGMLAEAASIDMGMTAKINDAALEEPTSPGRGEGER